MLTFNQYLKEMAFSKLDDEVKEDEVMENLKTIGNKPILWRGQTVGRRVGKMNISYSGIVHVTNDRENFKGKFGNSGLEQVLKGIGIKHQPIFCTFDKLQAKSFGSLGCVLPIGDFTLFWNNKIEDLAIDFSDSERIPTNDSGTAFEVKKITKSKNEIKSIVDSYKSSDTIENQHTNEVILDCKEYYWITIDRFFDIAKKSKFNTFKSVDEIKTYKDLYTIYKGYRSYLNWLKKEK